MRDTLLHNLLLVIAYVAGAKLCQSFAIEPGNVTPIWLSSGVSFIWVYLKGNKVLPGVFVGAFVGNVSAYIFSPDAPDTMLCILAGLLNGLGDSLCVWTGVTLLKTFAPNQHVFSNIKTASLFIFGSVVLGSMISALFGVTGLWLAGLIPTAIYSEVFVTWTVGDFMGILLLVPILESVLARNLRPKFKNPQQLLETLVFLLIAMGSIFLSIRYQGSFTSYLAIVTLVPLLTIYSVRQQEFVVTSAAFFIGAFTLTTSVMYLPPTPVEANLFILQTQLVLFSMLSTMLLIASSVNNINGLNEKITQEKSMFLANMSHEIRTPLTGVLGLTDMLLKTEINRHQRDMLINIQSSGKMLRRVINDVLDQSKINAGKLDISYSDFELKGIPELAVSIFSSTAKENGVSLTTVIDDTLPPIISGDVNRIRQVLFNFVSNAIKFSNETEISIEIKPHQEMIEFAVRDGGIGIAEDVLPKLFRPFEQANQEITRLHGGTGLGLSISKDLIKLMGGEIGAESQLGVGSRFWFRIPLLAADGNKKLEQETSDESPSDKILNVLVAEDVEINQIVLESLLEERGHTCTLANDGQEAIDMFKEELFDLVLMDIRMPRVDGVEALKQIRNMNHERSGIPIIAITADVAEGHVKEFLAAGFNAVAHKPVEADHLFSLIRKMT